MKRRFDPRREDGVAMAEFALVAPVFLLLVVGLLVFGRLFFYWIQANHVANETARWAVVDNNPYDSACENGPWTGADGCQTLQQAARTSASREFQDNVEVCIDLLDESLDTVAVGDPIEVEVRVPVTFVNFFGFDVTIRGTSTMRVESFRDDNPLEYSDAVDAVNNDLACT